MSLHQFWWSAEQIRGLGMWCCGSGAEWTVRKHRQRTQPRKALSNANTIQRTQPINYFDNNVSSCFILIQSVFVILHGVFHFKIPVYMYNLVSFHIISDCLQRMFFRQEDLYLIQRDNLWFECQRILHSNFCLFNFNQNFQPPKRPFKRLEYKDAITYLKEHDIKKDDGTFYEFGEVMYMYI